MAFFIAFTQFVVFPYKREVDMMSKRKAVYTELLHAEKMVYEAINKLVAARSKGMRWVVLLHNF